MSSPIISALHPFSVFAAHTAAITAALLWLPANATSEAVDFEAALSFPQASNLVASPVADRIGWVNQQQGIRNLWIAEGPEWTGQRVTNYNGDDGYAISDLQFSADNAAILFLRGGARNSKGDLPNPTSDPAGVTRTLWMASLDDDAPPVALAQTDDFALLPNGDAFIYLKDKQVWMESLPEGSDAATSKIEIDETEPKPLFTVRRGVAAFSIAPNGRKIAFVSPRGDHAFVGVYDLEQKTIIWMAPSLDKDQSPAWSPDSTQIAFLRIPNEKLILPFTPRRKGLPWSIHVSDVATGKTREVFRADPGPGSAFGAGYWFYGDRLWWGADDRIVFPWERTGWQHLWSVRSTGGEPVDLTPGEGEVQYAALAHDRSAMLYSSNHHDLHRRHVWQVPVGGGVSKLLTPGAGIEWLAARTGSGSLAFLASSAKRAAHPVVLVDGQRAEPGPALPEQFPVDYFIAPELVAFPAADGLPVQAQLFLPPPACGSGPHAGLLFFHGGSRRQMLMGFHPSGYYANAYAFNQIMATRCFVVAAVNYRSGAGYGLNFREALDYGARGASEYRDVVGAGMYLAGREDVDANRLALWGGSYGGYLTALGLAQASDMFAAGVDLHGVHDWNVVIRNFDTSYNAGTREDFARVAYASSPMAHVKTWRSPVLLIHGDDDRNVPFSESVDLAEALRRNGTHFESLIFPDEVHGFLLHRNWLAAYRAAAEFLERTLSTQAEVPPLGE